MSAKIGTLGNRIGELRQQLREKDAELATVHSLRAEIRRLYSLLEAAHEENAALSLLCANYCEALEATLPPEVPSTPPETFVSFWATEVPLRG